MCSLTIQCTRLYPLTNTSSDRTRYAHSAETWVALWKQVFTSVRGEEFARDKVVVKAELKENAFGGAIQVAGRTHHFVLYWSVEISA